MLEQDGELAFLSAIWFWMTPQCPKPSCHQVMQEIYDESATSYSSSLMSKKGFLHTVNIINGDVECRSSGNGKPLLRSKLYKYYMKLIGFSSTEIANEDLGEYKTVCNEGGTMVKYTSCDFKDVVINSCSKPGLGEDKELSGGTASLDASIASLKTGESIAWYKDGVLIPGETGTTYTATEVGTYKVVVTGADCTQEDEIIISAEVFVCTQPALGKDKELVSGTTTLDAGITLASGETIAWYKDGVLISGATSTTYTATAAGTYKAVTTRPGCTSEDEIIIYNEGEGPTCSRPALDDTLELTGSSVTLNTGITALQPGETIAWYKDGTAIWGATGTTYTATQVGTYKAVVTGSDCTEEDEVVVAVICSKPDLGGDKGFSGSPVTLDAGVTLKTGETIAWYKDGVQQWGTSGTTFSATTIGTYKVVIKNGTSCTAEDEIEVAEKTCSKPDLGKDVSLCAGTSLTLNVNVVLETGETLKWYKDGVEIAGATATTYSASAIGTYKAEVNTTDNCVNSDEIVVKDGGSQKLVVTASNNGEFCEQGATNSVTLTVTGGAGTYDFYDVPADGTPLGSGASFTVDGSHVNEGQTKTFYVQEPSGPAATIGASTAYTSGAWANMSTNQNWNNYRVALNTLDKVTLESADFVFYQNHVSHDLVITVYEYGTENVVKTKTIQLDGNTLQYVAGSTYPLNTVQLDLELPAGNYEVSFIGSTFTFHIVQSGIDYSDPMFSESGVAEIKGINQPGSWNYPDVNPSHLGVYNWVFKTGGAGACGRAEVNVTANCGITTGINEAKTTGLLVFPNPASTSVNIDLSGIISNTSLVEIYNSTGQLVKSKQVNSNLVQLNTNGLESGLYLVKVQTTEKVYTEYMVIKK